VAVVHRRDSGKVPVPPYPKDGHSLFSKGPTQRFHDAEVSAAVATCLAFKIDRTKLQAFVRSYTAYCHQRGPECNMKPVICIAFFTGILFMSFRIAGEAWMIEPLERAFQMISFQVALHYPSSLLSTGRPRPPLPGAQTIVPKPARP
jgi:hypothetical protein